MRLPETPIIKSGAMITGTILAVDGNDIHRLTLVNALQSAGFDVIHAGSGTEALSMAREGRPDLLLLGIPLPDLDGYQVCCQIKNSPELAGIPVVFYTADAKTEAARSHAKSVRATAFLIYPIEPEHLIAVVLGSLARTAHSA